MGDDFTRLAGSYYTLNLQNYLESVYVKPTRAQALAEAAGQRAEMPQIQISSLDGLLISVLLKMIGAKKVVEIGTLSGYSGVWIAESLPEDGHLWTIEYDEKHAQVAQGVFDEAGFSDRITLTQGAGLDILPTLESEGPFDAVFMDADKVNMPNYLDWASKNLRKGGLVLGDNSFLFGYLSDREPEDPEYNHTIDEVKRFHRNLAEQFDAVPIPTPQGLSVGIKR